MASKTAVRSLEADQELRLKRRNTLLAQEQILGVIYHHGLDLVIGHALSLECRKEILGYMINVPIFEPGLNLLRGFG